MQIFEQRLYCVMRPNSEHRNGEPDVMGASFQKDKKVRKMEGGSRTEDVGAKRYLWSYPTSHLHCNL